MRVKFTKQSIAKATSTITDTEIKQLELRVLPTGGKRYGLRWWCSETKSTKRLALGDAETMTPAQAREAAESKLLELRGDREAIKIRAKNKTVAELFKEYATEYSAKEHAPEWHHKILRYWENHLKVLGHYRIAELEEKHIREFKKSKENYSAAYRNKMLQVLRDCYSMAIKKKYIQDSPLEYIKRDKSNNAGRRLTSEEIAKLLAALQDDYISKAVRLALFTGVRRGNVLGAHSSEFDFKKRIWTIQKEKVKNKETQTVHLSIYTGVDKFNGFLFQCRSRIGYKWNLTDEYKQLLERAGLDTSIRFHDLKHTFVSCAYRAGIDPHLVYKLGGHKLPGMSFHYAHEEEGELKEAYNRVGEFIAGHAQN